MCPKTLTPRMKHTRVPRTVRRDIWRLAIETLSIPSLHIFSKPNPESDRKSNRKPEKEEWTEPKIKLSNKEKKIHVPCTTLNYYLGWLMWCKVCINYEPSCKNNGAAEIQSAIRYFRPNESALHKRCTNINQPYLIWAAAVLCCHVPPTKGQGY